MSECARALDEYEKKRYMVVGDLAIKTVEQAIEALAALEGKHCHLLPRSAHSNRVRWIKERFPSLSKDMDDLWSAYGALVYDGFSDYDLLVLFGDKALMWQNWDELFQATGNLKMNLHVIPEALEELKAVNPV